METHVPISDTAPPGQANRADRSPSQVYGATLRPVAPALIDSRRRWVGSCLARLDVAIWRQIARCMAYLQSGSHPADRSN